MRPISLLCSLSVFARLTFLVQGNPISLYLPFGELESSFCHESELFNNPAGLPLPLFSPPAFPPYLSNLSETGGRREAGAAGTIPDLINSRGLGSRCGFILVAMEEIPRAHPSVNSGLVS